MKDKDGVDKDNDNNMDGLDTEDNKENGREAQTSLENLSHSITMKTKLIVDPCKY